MVAPDSKRAFGLTSDTTHRQTLLQELHKEVERTLLNTDEVSQLKSLDTHSSPTKKLFSNYIVLLKPNEWQSTKSWRNIATQSIESSKHKQNA
jgi:hypothetical protein